VTIEVGLENRDPVHDDQRAVKISVPAVTDCREERVDSLGTQIGMRLALDRGPATVAPDRQDQGPKTRRLATGLAVGERRRCREFSDWIKVTFISCRFYSRARVPCFKSYRCQME
jgi:hypothetical protein